MKTIPITNSRKTGKSSGKIVKGAVASTCGALVIAGLAALFTPSEAQAFSCGRNVYGAGCVSQRGAVAFNRNGAVAVGRYGNVYAYHRGSTCYWRNNQRICP